MLNNAGGAWDNAKKYIEKGAHGGKKLPDGTKNPVHGAAVVGDTVGDPFKDTSGPSLNILIKLMTHGQRGLLRCDRQIRAVHQRMAAPGQSVISRSV